MAFISFFFRFLLKSVAGCFINSKIEFKVVLLYVYRNWPCPYRGSIENLGIVSCCGLGFLELWMGSPVPGGNNILVSFFYQTIENLVIHFAGCSLLGVGIKFRPLDKSDISSLFDMYVLKLMMFYGRVLSNVQFFFVAWVPRVAIFGFCVVSFLLSSVLVSLTMLSIISYTFCHCVGGGFSYMLSCIGPKSSCNMVSSLDQ